MSIARTGLFLWRTRLALFGVWATLVLLWRRGGYLGFPSLAELHYQELQIVAALVLLPGVIILLGVPPARYAAGLFGVLLIGGLVAESIAFIQEQRFVSRCEQSSGAGAIEAYRFPGELGGRMLFVRSPDGSEAFHFQD